MHFLKFAATMAATFCLTFAQGESHITTTTVIRIDLYPAVSTSTAYATRYYTVLGCPPWVLDCPTRQSVTVVTATTAFATTICPLTLTQSYLSSFPTTVLSTSEPVPPPPFSTVITTYGSTLTVPSGSTLPNTLFDIPSSVWSSIFSNGLPTSTGASSHSESGAFNTDGSGGSSESFVASSTSSSEQPPDVSEFHSVPAETTPPDTLSELVSLSSLLTWQTSVSAHDSIITVPDGAPTISISIGSLTAVIPLTSTMNTTSLVSAYVGYPLSPVTSSPPNATFSIPKALSTGSVQATTAASSTPETWNATTFPKGTGMVPQYSNLASVTTSDLSSIVVAIIIASLLS